MVCLICNELKPARDHEISPKHLRNTALDAFSKNRKKYAGNRDGVIISCVATSSADTTESSVKPRIKISARPNQVAKFNFKVYNETSKQEILLLGTELAHSEVNFIILNQGPELGEEPYLLKPKTYLLGVIEVTFSSSHTGQYNMPIIFHIQKQINNEKMIIIRDMVVMVESNQKIRPKVANPYKGDIVEADKFVPTVTRNKSNDIFPVPKNLKQIFKAELKLENPTPEEKTIVDGIMKSFQVGVTHDNYTDFFHYLLWYDETSSNTLQRKYNMSGVPLCQNGNYYLLNVPGVAEKRPPLMKRDKVYIRLHKNKTIMFEGIIEKIESSEVVHIGGLHENAYYKKSARYDIRFIMSRVPLERMHAAVHAIGRNLHLDKIFPTDDKKRLKCPRIKPSNFFNPLVCENAEQRAAVERIVGRGPVGGVGGAPFVLHGPPGTGKTVTIVEAILQVLKKNEKNRVLVCTESNMAADHIAITLIKYIKHFNSENFLLRANSQFRNWKTLPKNLDKYSLRGVNDKKVNAHRLVIMTLSHAAVYKKCNAMTHLFIDEAAQASEPSSLVPLCAMLAPQGTLVLAGDHRQLGPVIMSRDAAEKGLAKSLMERLMESNPLYMNNNPNYTVMLKKNFRSHPDILEIPNEIFYNGNLTSHAVVDPLSTTDILGNSKQSRAIVFHGCSSKAQKIGKSPSFFNDMELGLVQEYVNVLMDRHRVRPEDIGVIAPYQRQVNKISKWLEEKGFDKTIEVGSVESFQGKEKRVIIITTVRANCGLLEPDGKFKLGFLVDDKRFNVALTRAKAKLIIVGNPLCLTEDENWNRYIQLCRQYNTYFGFDILVERHAQIKRDLEIVARRINGLCLSDE